MRTTSCFVLHKIRTLTCAQAVLKVPFVELLCSALTLALTPALLHGPTPASMYVALAQDRGQIQGCPCAEHM